MVGLYSTRQQWAQIVGAVGRAASSPGGTPGWPAHLAVRGDGRLHPPPLAPRGRVTLSQYVVSGLDRNYSCR